MSRHRPIEVVYDGRRQCSACSLDVIGEGVSLRHADEAVAVLTPDPQDARSVERAMAIARSVARRLSGASDEDIAEAVTQELYGAGFLRRNRGPQRGSIVLVDEAPRDPDHAERAAGEKIPA